jgi:hypothetical protein
MHVLSPTLTSKPNYPKNSHSPKETATDQQESQKDMEPTHQKTKTNSFNDRDCSHACSSWRDGLKLGGRNLLELWQPWINHDTVLK